jgi:hypothetical protein
MAMNELPIPFTAEQVAELLRVAMSMMEGRCHLCGHATVDDQPCEGELPVCHVCAAQMAWEAK